MGAAPGQPPRWLTGLFAESLGIPVPELDTAAAFGELGVESVLLGELLLKLETRLGQPLEPTLLLDYPTIDLLGARLTTLFPAGEAMPAEETRPRPGGVGVAGADAGGGRRKPLGYAPHAVAVVGLACRFPGAPDLDAFWDLLRRGDCAVTEVPAGRWDVAGLYDPNGGRGRSVSKWGGFFVSGIEDFDPEFFQMTEADARNLDPGIRMVLETHCQLPAGRRVSGRGGARPGRRRVHRRAACLRYRQRVSLACAVSGLGGDQNFLAAMLAQQYDFRGPNLVVDSACSSALVSVQLACRSLLAGESALRDRPGGVEVLLDEQAYLEFTAAKALSRHGRCAAFSQDADGFVPGEGCGLLLLKPLSGALRDGDRIHAVIESAAVANDGRTMGLTTPNPLAQGEVVRRALRLAGLAADDIGLVEAHGTATMIGDPIELRALTDVYRAQTTPRRLLRHRQRQVERRPPAQRGRDRRAHQGAAGPGARADPADALLRRAQPAVRLRRLAVLPGPPS